MLMLPHLIDDLEGRVKRSTLIKIPGSGSTVEHFIKLARSAEKFSFGEIPLEEDPDPAKAQHGRNVWVSPQITKVEQEAWDEGLIPLPAPVCWYEYLLGNEPTGLLIAGDGKARDMWVCRTDYNHRTNGGVYHGTWVAQDSAGEGELVQAGGAIPFWKRHGDGKFVVRAPAKALEFIRELHKKGQQALELASDHYLAIYLTLMLSSLTTEIRTERAPEKLNRKRMKLGREPLPDHRVVTIVPERYIDRGEGQGGHHRSPRLHWRSSHIRHYENRTPSSTFSPHAFHKGKTGWWLTLIARQLVGKKELGEITHEYFVREGEKV